MVWFQCERCGDNFKKPKLVAHSSSCRGAVKFSCIDCGVVFDLEGGQKHTQCVSEAEKYGPKGGSNKDSGTQRKNPAQVCEELVNHGLTTRAPWACKLCNVQATSRETLLVHGKGKKHVSKARAALAAAGKPIPGQQEEKKSSENGAEKETPEVVDVHAEKGGDEDVKGLELASSDPKKGGEDVKKVTEKKVTKKEKKTVVTEQEVEITIEEKQVINGEEAEKKKKKKRKGGEAKPEAEKIQTKKTKTNEEAQTNGVEGGEKKNNKRKAEEEVKLSGDEPGQVKWRKLVSKHLKLSDSDKVKLRKLEKILVPEAIEAGATVDATALKSQLRDYISSSNRFVVVGKYVRFASS